MNTLNLLSKNLVETSITGGIGAIGTSYLFSGGGAVFDSNIPIIDLLNDTNMGWIYFILFGGATALSNVTGDFIFPLISNKPYLSYLNKFNLK